MMIDAREPQILERPGAQRIEQRACAAAASIAPLATPSSSA